MRVEFLLGRVALCNSRSATCKCYYYGSCTRTVDCNAAAVGRAKVKDMESSTGRQGHARPISTNLHPMSGQPATPRCTRRHRGRPSGIKPFRNTSNGRNFKFYSWKSIFLVNHESISLARFLCSASRRFAVARRFHGCRQPF